MADANTLSRGALFPAQLVTDLFSTVKGKSSLAKLSNSTPVGFNGNQQFTFSLDNEVSIVGENEKKVPGGATLTPVTVIPFKFEYGARVSDEFMYASEEAKIDILRAFSEGFSAKLAKGFDIAAMHGINPRTGTASTVVGTNHFDAKVTQKVTLGTGATVDDDMESAIALVDAAEYDVNGAAISPAFRASLAALKTTDGSKIYPDLAWGSQPSSINGLPISVNSTVAKALAGDTSDAVIVGDFSAFKWGYAKEIPLRVIEYGDPDNTGVDLAGSNQVYLRAEAYIGWGILVPDAFAIVE